MDNVLGMNKKIGSFTGLRFIMIMSIVITHFEFLIELPTIGDFFSKYLHNATFAVDFFFLLSGFGMMFGSLNKTPLQDIKKPDILNCLRYGLQHIKKIYPVYIATIVFSLCGQFVYAIIQSNISLSFFIEHAIKLLINIPLLQSATGMITFTHAYNGVSWFLSSLFCIYLISPLLIFLLRIISKSIYTDIAILVLNIAISILIIYPFKKLEFKYTMIDILVYGSPYRRVFYVLIGMNLATIFYRIKSSAECVSRKTYTYLESFISIITVIYFLSRNSLHFGNLIYLIDLLLCASFIIIFAFDKGFISSILNKKTFQDLGNKAMYIFLIHYPIRIYCGWFVEKIWGWTTISSIIFIIFILVSTFFISDILYKKPKALSLFFNFVKEILCFKPLNFANLNIKASRNPEDKSSGK